MYSWKYKDIMVACKDRWWPYPRPNIYFKHTRDFYGRTPDVSSGMLNEWRQQ